MREGRQLEVRPGDTVFVSVDITGEASMCYTRGGHISVLLEAFERFLKAEGFSFGGHLDFIDDDGASEWAVDVRNFLDNLTNPEMCGYVVSDEVRQDAARLRDA